MSNSMKSLCIVLLLLACGRLSAQNQEHRVRNVVLVHGAWADGSGWKRVYDILVKDGYNGPRIVSPYFVPYCVPRSWLAAAEFSRISVPVSAGSARLCEGNGLQCVGTGKPICSNVSIRKKPRSEYT